MTVPTNDRKDGQKQSDGSGVLWRILALFGIPILVVLAIKLLFRL